MASNKADSLLRDTKSEHLRASDMSLRNTEKPDLATRELSDLLELTERDENETGDIGSQIAGLTTNGDLSNISTQEPRPHLALALAFSSSIFFSMSFLCGKTIYTVYPNISPYSVLFLRSLGSLVFLFILTAIKTKGRMYELMIGQVGRANKLVFSAAIGHILIVMLIIFYTLQLLPMV